MVLGGFCTRSWFEWFGIGGGSAELGRQSRYSTLHFGPSHYAAVISAD